MRHSHRLSACLLCRDRLFQGRLLALHQVLYMDPVPPSFPDPRSFLGRPPSLRISLRQGQSLQLPRRSLKQSLRLLSRSPKQSLQLPPRSLKQSLRLLSRSPKQSLQLLRRSPKQSLSRHFLQTSLQRCCPHPRISPWQRCCSPCRPFRMQVVPVFPYV